MKTCGKKSSEMSSASSCMLPMLAYLVAGLGLGVRLRDRG